MDHTGPSLEEDELFGSAADEVMARLEKATDRDGVLGALRWGMGALDRAYTSTPEKIRGQASCRAGCDFCCRVPLGVQAHEVFLAVDFLLKRFRPEQVTALVERARLHRDKVLAVGAAGYHSLMQACALLQDGKCTIYDARPEICRAHHSRDPRACEAYLADQSVDLEAVYIPKLRRRMFAVMLGTDHAFAESGFDSQAYDFGSALYEALTDELCAVRWARKQSAFSRECREPD